MAATATRRKISPESNLQLGSIRKPPQSAAVKHVPKWSSGDAYFVNREPAPIGLSHFEQLVQEIGNPPEALWKDEPALLRFARAHRNTRYVPEWLLAAWGLPVRTDVSD